MSDLSLFKVLRSRCDSTAVTTSYSRVLWHRWGTAGIKEKEKQEEQDKNPTSCSYGQFKRWTEGWHPLHQAWECQGWYKFCLKLFYPYFFTDFLGSQCMNLFIMVLVYVAFGNFGSFTEHISWYVFYVL